MAQTQVFPSPRQRVLMLERDVQSAKDAVRDFLDTPAREALHQLGLVASEPLMTDEKDALRERLHALREALTAAEDVLLDYKRTTVAGVLPAVYVVYPPE